jgi:hypothetical protein
MGQSIGSLERLYGWDLMSLQDGKPQFEQFRATHLYCSRCEASMPVREVLLLVLSDGELYDYRCARCGESVGTRTEAKGLTRGIGEVR